jgi:hypothetical protein
VTTRQPPRRPAFVGPAALEAHGGTVDPVQEIEAAHETARVLVTAGRDAADPVTTARLVGLVEQLGLSTVADLWSHRPARTLPGALWRLYVVREWVRRDGPQASAEYSTGMTYTGVDHAVAGAAEPISPEELVRTVDAILAGVFDGDLDVALERAGAFCRVVATGRAALTDGPDSARRAATLMETAQDLDACASLWRRDTLD